MGIVLLGERQQSGAIFNRSYFDTLLEQAQDHGTGPDTPAVKLFLMDGSTIQVCHVIELADQFISVASYQDEDGACEAHGGSHEPSAGPRCCAENLCKMNIDMIPYPLIYRIEISRRGAGSERIGFHLSPKLKKK